MCFQRFCNQQTPLNWVSSVICRDTAVWLSSGKMSLFETKQWWAAQISAGEQFVDGSLAVGNVDNEKGGQSELPGVVRGPRSIRWVLQIADKIVSGSLQGTLRIFAPRQPDFSPDDLMLETSLDAPILAVAIGKFVS
jgi:hypothetical protein